MFAINDAPKWVIIVLLILILLGVVYSITLDCKRSILVLEFGTGDSCKPYSEFYISTPIKLGEGIHREGANNADKSFIFNSECPIGAITSATNEVDGKKQAAICTCLDAKEGRGWHCFN